MINIDSGSWGVEAGHRAAGQAHTRTQGSREINNRTEVIYELSSYYNDSNTV